MAVLYHYDLWSKKKDTDPTKWSNPEIDYCEIDGRTKFLEILYDGMISLEKDDERV